MSEQINIANQNLNDNKLNENTTNNNDNTQLTAKANSAQEDTAKKANNDDTPEYVYALERKIRRERIILNNPVIMQGIGLAPLIVACISANNAVLLSTSVFLLLTPTRILASILCQKMPARFKGFVYAFCSATVFIGVYYVLSLLFNNIQIVQIGLYLPLLVMDPIILKRYEHVLPEKPKNALKKGIITSIGYILVVMCIGITREFLGVGSIFGIQIINFALLPFALTPTGGFIILAILMALWRSVTVVLIRYMYEEKALQ